MAFHHGTSTKVVSRLWLCKLWNFFGCIAALYFFAYVAKSSQSPLTIDVFIKIFLAELNRFINGRRRQGGQVSGQKPRKNKGIEKQPLRLEPVPIATPQCMAAIVGYREDPGIFKKALESYNDARSCSFVMVGVDGDALEDQEMVDVFLQVYPYRSAVLHLDVPLAETALQLNDDINPKASQWSPNSPEDSGNVAIIRTCCRIARKALEDNKINVESLDGITRLCVRQPHMHKKGIMFTAFIFSIVICEILDIDFVWSSDSDSFVYPSTIQDTVLTMANDDKIGGASTAMMIHNRDDSIVTQLGSSVYLSEMYLTRSFTSARAANDCQSGPCAMFRIAVLPSILMKWYQQAVLGHWMIVNEDRHLTTCLLLERWKVVFVADVFTATETPQTLRRWLLQQVRWARAVHIESLHRPEIYLLHSPVLFFAAIRGEIATLAVPISVLVYLLTGKYWREFSWVDLGQRIGLTMGYVALRNPYQASLKAWLWVLPGQLFYNAPLPGIQFWSALTLLNDSWGTTMRASGEMSVRAKLWTKVCELGFIVLWFGLLGGAAGRILASALDVSFPSFLALVFGPMLTLWGGFGWWLVVTKG